LRVLTWNLYHGRSDPPAGRSLAPEFAAQIAAWPWDVALLQEVPPWWTSHLARSAGADGRTAMTSRNALLPLRRAVADRHPDLIKSNCGGSNVLLVRGDPIYLHRAIPLRRWPERRVAQLVRLESGTVVVNTHLSTPASRTPDRRARAREELARLWTLALAAAGQAPLILGGDLNLFHPDAPFAQPGAVGHAVDHIVARGCGPILASERPDHSVVVDGRRVRLSDHEPLIAELRDRS
jgi:endonuclease/exonuclease/phosphatase family metal-dependent hydrolase